MIEIRRYSVSNGRTTGLARGIGGIAATDQNRIRIEIQSVDLTRDYSILLGYEDLFRLILAVPQSRAEERLTALEWAQWALLSKKLLENK
jgi:hypothetical protein